MSYRLMDAQEMHDLQNEDLERSRKADKLLAEKRAKEKIMRRPTESENPAPPTPEA